MWSTLSTRVGDRSGHAPAYVGVELRMTRQEFLTWAVVSLRKWWKSHPGETPSLDRRDSRGHYEIGNLRITTCGENTLNRPCNKNVSAPHGKAWCGGCKQYLLKSKFSKRSRSVGVQGKCRQCFAAYMRAWKKRKKETS